MATVGLLGASAFRWAVLPGFARRADEDTTGVVVGEATKRLAQAVLWLGLIAAGANVARLAAQHAAVFGTDDLPSRSSVAALLFRSGWGKSWWLLTAAAVALVALAPRLQRRVTWAWGVAALATLLLALSQPMAGHPAAAEHPWRAIVLQTVHLVGAGGWLGSLAMLTFVAAPVVLRTPADLSVAPLSQITSLVRAFSPTALGFSALLVLTGAIIAWEHLGDLSALWAGDYGRTLLLKLALWSITAAIGAYNWRRVLPRLGTAAAGARLAATSRVELAIGVAVLVVTAVLVATPMPGE